MAEIVHYIEDPATAATIDALRERWPRIAAAADCQLTEHFIRRSTRGRIVIRIIGAKSKLFSILIIMVYMAWLTFPQPRGVWNVITAIFVIQVLVAIVRIAMSYHQKKFQIKNLREPIDLLSENDPGRLDQLYLANVQFKDLLGATAALYHHHWVGCAAARAAMLAGAWMVLAVAIGLIGQKNINILIDACAVVFFVGIGWVVCRPAAIVQTGMRDLFLRLRPRKSVTNARSAGVLPGFLWFIMACTPVITGIIYPVLGVPGWIGLTIAAWIAEFARLGYVMDHELVMFFDHCLDNGDRMFQSMLSQETSDPLKELEIYGRMMLAEHRHNIATRSKADG